MLERYLIPLAPYFLLALASTGGLLLFGSLEREIRRLKSRVRRQPQAELVSQEEVRIRLERLNERLQEAEERYRIPAPALITPSLNLNKRTQALRMSRRGAPADKIAAALNLPSREVELLLKIHALTFDPPAS
jgi:hypothetical protein